MRQAVKDECARARWIVTQGSRIFRGDPQTEDNRVIDKLLVAGTILHVQSTAPELYLLGVTQSDLWGVTRTPGPSRAELFHHSKTFNAKHYARSILSMVASATAFLQHSDRSSEVLSRTDPTPSHCDELTHPDRALVALGRELRNRGYSFTTITPLSHRRVIARPSKSTPTLPDIFGWSRPFADSDVASEILRLMTEAQVLQRDGDRLRSAVRFSSLGGQLFAHSAFPTEQADAVFFGPDTYRFARALRQMLAAWQPQQSLRVLDVGAGSGAGGLHAATLLRNARIVLSDINNSALRFSRINALINEVQEVEVVDSDVCENVSGAFDLIVSNPPYLVDPLARLYRHGGGALGFELSLKIAEQGLARLARGGRLFLYTGSAIVDGHDAFRQGLQERLKGRARIAYEEIDPDVFGEELESPPYDRADRIAAVAATIEAL